MLLDEDIIFPGFPNTIELAGTSKLTYAPGPINTLSSILIPPTTIELMPNHTRFPMVGIPFFSPLLVCPMVTPLAIFTLFPMQACGFMVIPHICPM